jgi:murein DD-endopeptidase MepM/ murein hydrolase activator NlpD
VRRGTALIAATLLPVLAAASESRRCSADLVCVEARSAENGPGSGRVALVLESFTDKPLTFGLFLSPGLEELEPPPRRLGGPGYWVLLSFPRPSGSWGFDFRIHYGHAAHAHDDDHVYTLPYAPGACYPVTQTGEHLTTHRLGNRNAVDFAMPVGDAVHAARGGRVVSVYAGSRSGSDTGLATGNHVWIRHDDGTIGKYLHLDHGGALVAEGQRLAAGELIGRAGNTGYTSGPHLHFSVSTLGGDALYQTFRARFATERGPAFLAVGDCYRRPEQPAVDRWTH